MIEEQVIYNNIAGVKSNILYMCKVRKESLHLHTTKTDIGRPNI